MNVLVINCGSSSLKYQLINSDTEAVLAKGLCERIGIDGRLVYQKAGCDKEVTEASMPTHKEAIQMVLDALTNEKTCAISSLKEVNAIGHRVVHGGEKFASSAVITDEMIAAVEECNDLAPLHNPANLIGIRVCAELMPGVPQVGVFDTAFHQTMPAKAYLYGLPLEYYQKYKVRRYGFHGTSHSFVSKRAVEFLGLDPENSKVIVCHLGNGSSISAVVNGKCVDTTMGLTPLEGVVMGTRSGNIDPAIMEYIAKKEKDGKNNEKVTIIAAIIALVIFNVLSFFFLYTDFNKIENLSLISLNIDRLTFAGWGILMIILGNVMPKLRMNSIIGLRTKWSMKNETAWKKSQFCGGISFIAVGVIILIICILVKNIDYLMWVTGILAVLIVIDVWMTYKIAQKY